MTKKKLKLSFLGMLLAGACAGQSPFSGPTGLGNYYMDQGIMTLNSFTARTSIGACWGGGADPLWGDGYVGFNLAYDGTPSQPWTYRGGGEGGVIYLNASGEMHFVTRASTGGNGGYLTNTNIKNLTRMRIDPNGKVAIGNGFITQGITTDGNYKLYVEDGILTERVRVAIRNSNDWKDYVFNDDYKLMPLNDLRNYIKEHNHLPQIPSTKEVIKDGIDLGEMNAKLLQKIEELTLYVIQQQAEIDALKEHNKK